MPGSRYTVLGGIKAFASIGNEQCDVLEFHVVLIMYIAEHAAVNSNALEARFQRNAVLPTCSITHSSPLSYDSLKPFTTYCLYPIATK